MTMVDHPTQSLFYENSPIKSINLPLRIKCHLNNASGLGCHFHWHEQIEFYFVTDGGLKLNVAGEEHRLMAGDIGFIGWGHPHRGSEFNDKTKHYIVQIDVKNIPLLKDYVEFLTPTKSFHSILKQDKDLIQSFESIIQEETTKSQGYELLVMANIMVIFTHILRNYRRHPVQNPILHDHKSLNHVHKILHFINENYQSKINLDDMAKSLGLSKSYMCRIFKKHTNQTIIQHLNEQKCHYAASLIYDGHDLLTVSEMVGFEDYNYFSRTFNKIMGKRPTTFLCISDES